MHSCKVSVRIMVDKKTSKIIIIKKNQSTFNNGLEQKKKIHFQMDGGTKETHYTAWPMTDLAACWK